jgi:fructose-1,6-bisphosphatase II
MFVRARPFTLNYKRRLVVSKSGPDYSVVQRNVALDLVRVTEAAALGAAKWLGKGDKNAADAGAVELMRKVINTVEIDGKIVIGEGEKDKAPMLYCGEKVGSERHSVKVDIAVDPLDGTTLVAHGKNGAVSVIALAEKGTLFNPKNAFYMEKLVVGPNVPADMISLDNTLEQNMKIVSAYLKKPLSDVTVVMLDRERHTQLIKECRKIGVRIRLISDGDVGASIDVAKEDSPVDVLIGIGGSPEGVIAACAMKIMGGSIQARLWAKDDKERNMLLKNGLDTTKILTTNDLCKGKDVFFAATGVTDSDLLKGVRFVSGGAITHSVVMRSKSGTIRYLESHHKWNDYNHIN